MKKTIGFLPRLASSLFLALLAEAALAQERDALAPTLRENVVGWRSGDWMNAREVKCYREVGPYDPIAELGCMMEEAVKRYLYLNGLLRQLSGKGPIALEGVSE